MWVKNYINVKFTHIIVMIILRAIIMIICYKTILISLMISVKLIILYFTLFTYLNISKYEIYKLEENI